MSYNIYVVDLETTGLQGAPYDKVVEVGVARVDLDLGKVYPERGMIINQKLTEEQKKSWVFEHTNLTPEEVEASPYSPGHVSYLLDDYVNENEGPFTAYNAAFDFDQFLQYDPFFFKPARAPCIKEMVAVGFNNGRWMTAQEAYSLLCPDNPARVPDGIEEHRALSDAVLEGYILLRMCERKPEIRGRYLQAWEMMQI